MGISSEHGSTIAAMACPFIKAVRHAVMNLPELEPFLVIGDVIHRTSPEMSPEKSVMPEVPIRRASRRRTF